MNKDFERFLSQPETARRDAFDATAHGLGSQKEHIEKDFWVCFSLDAVFNRLPDGHPQSLFKGGTSLSKGHDLIHRFSEDVDIVTYREDLGFGPDRDPTISGGLSNKKRKALFEELKTACGDYIRNDLSAALETLMGEHCHIMPDDEDPDQQTLLIRYPTLYPTDEHAYVQPVVKLEAGARSALDPNTMVTIEPYISDEVKDGFSLAVPNIRTIEPTRTYLDKLMILHGAHCGYRDQNRVPTDKQRVSRHYYDVAMLTGTDVEKAALADEALVDSVREHNKIAFRQAWRKMDEAVPGTFCIAPPVELHAALKRDYDAMRGMMFGDAPNFKWIVEQLRIADDTANRR